MALKRSDIRAILEAADTSNDEKAKKILDALHAETDALKDQLDETNTKLSAAEKARDEALGGKQSAEKALTDYKTEQAAKATRAGKTEKFKALLKDAGVHEKYIDRVLRLSGDDIDKLELDNDGNVKDAKKQVDSLKAEWSDYVTTTQTKGTNVATPPANAAGKMTKEQIFAIKSPSERQAAIAANADLFTGGGKE